MWCKHCHQEVPGIARQGDQALCPRCGEAVEPSAPLAAPLPRTEKVPAGRCSSLRALVADWRPAPWDDWELDDTLRRIEVAVRALPSPPPTSRVDSAHAQPNTPHHAFPNARGVIRAVEEFQSRGVLPLLTWLALFGGTMAASCGGGLLVWSRLAARPELWGVGQPIALGGVCCLVVALILQLDAALGAKSS